MSSSRLHSHMQSPRQTPTAVPVSVLDTLANGGVVLCSNARAARALSRRYGVHVAAQGYRAWQTPQIVDWTQWLHAQWTQLLLTGKEERTLLTALQEEVLWNEIVRPAVEARSLIASGEVARLAASAYALLHTYQASDQLQRGEWDNPSLEPELFRKWALELERRCERNHWLCEARLPWIIAGAVRDQRLATPPAILWNGFDRLTAVDEAMRLALQHAGCVQSVLGWNVSATEHLLATPSRRQEVEACAEWARALLQQTPGATIGILLPDLETARPEVDRIFRRILSPDALDTGEETPAYEFTLGLPLADVPVIAAALSLLHWCVDPQQQETISWLMTTGFFTSGDHAAILAEADIKVRRHLSVPELEMEEALERLSKFAGPSGGNWAVTNWVRSLRKALGQFQKAQGRTRSCADWISVSLSILREAGWPGESEAQESDSVSFQVRDRWQRALEEVSALNFTDRRYEFRDFLSVLSSHLRNTIFSPESQHAPIIISGIPESAGRSFDALWIIGATDKALPSAARMHPLLPAWLQLERAMPGSSSEQDWQLASSALARLRASALEVVFSYAQEGTDGAQRPSSLLAHLDAEATAASSVPPALLLESFTDEMLVPWPGGRAAGGHGVLKDQAACPFKAFAAKRLGANDEPALELGLNAIQRGNVAHGVLASFWSAEQMRNSDHLRSAIFAGALTTLIQEHVAKEFEPYDARATTDWERSYLQLEKERVSALIEQWLRNESRRKPFAVEQVEKEETIQLDGLELSVRMDRIDKVDGGRLLIDYKTGRVDKDAWDGDRPSDPQLPIYATSGKVEELRDVLFARVFKDEMTFFSAVCESKPDIFPEYAGYPDAAARFEEKCREWTQVLHALSQDFQQGIATVTPKSYPATCKYCNFSGLCRVAESAPSFALLEEDAE